MDFALVVLKLSRFKVCGTMGILKIGFFNFSGTERVKKNQNNSKTIQNLLNLLVNHFSRTFNKIPIFFTGTLTFSLPVPCWDGDNCLWANIVF